MTRRMFSLALLVAVLLVAGTSVIRTETQAASPSGSLTQFDDPFLTQLSNDLDTPFMRPIVSGDGRWVAYTVRNGNTRAPLYYGPSDGSVAAQVIATPSPPGNYSISADGTVAYVSNADSDHYGLFIYKDGTVQEITPFVQHPSLGTKYLQPREVALSGDGKWVFITSTQAWPCHAENRGAPETPDWRWVCEPNPDLDTYQVFRVSVATRTAVRISRLQSEGLNGAFDLATDFSGSKVIFTCRKCDDGGNYLYVVNADGSGQEQLAAVYDEYSKGRLSGDGNWIIFPGNQGGEWGLDIIHPDGSGHRKLIVEDTSDGVPIYYDIDYDGSTIAFDALLRSAPCYASYNTFLINNDGTGLRCLLQRTEHTSAPAGHNPNLSYDGLTTVFISDDDLLGNGAQDFREQVFRYRGPAAKFVSSLDAQIGHRLYYTLTLHHGEDSGISASLTDPIPENTLYVPGSAWASKGAPSYDEGQRQVVWNGNIAPEEVVTVTFAVTVTCNTTPPPPTVVRNQASVTLGDQSYQPMAITTVELPEKELNALSDSPADGAQNVLIESGGHGPLLRWHDQAAGLACGTAPDDGVAYRVYIRPQGGSWQEVGLYPNCSRQVQLDPADLSCKDNGDPASYEWKVVAYDPEFPCREPVESLFRFDTASCRPELDIQPLFTLEPGYFLHNQSVDNRIRVLVDWNGPAYETPDTTPPYGDVYFDLNGEQVEVDGQSWGAEHTYDMGSDFQDGLDCANNTLRVWATYPVDDAEFRSLETVVQPTVFSWPDWVEWVITNIPGSDTSFETTPKAPLVRYAYHFAYPEEPFEATWTPPGWVPYLGGEEVGVLPTQAQTEVEAKSDGSGATEVSGETGLGLAAVSVEGRLWGHGEAQFLCHESLDLQRAELGFEISVPIEKEAGLADVIPGVRAAEDWPVVGRIIRWFNHIAKVKGTFTPRVEITTEFREQGGQLRFEQSTGTGAIGAQAELAAEPFEDLTASVYGGGTPYVTIQVPKNPGYLQEMGIDLYYGATFQVWEFEAEYERKVNCHHPGGCSEVAEAGPVASAAASQPDWHLIPRDYAGPDYARPVAPRLRATAALQATATATETLLTNIYPRPEPALAVRADGQRLLLYVHDDTAKPQGRGTEIHALSWDGSAWSGPVSLTDDAQPDFAPAVVFDGSGNGVAVWERSSLGAGISPALNITFAQSLEIAAATWNGVAWSGVTTLTNNGLMDTAPQLAATGDGGAMALWRTTDGDDLLGTATHPLTFTYALWNGSAWSAPVPALTGLHDVIDVAFAAYSSTRAALVYTVDADGVLSTTTDNDLYYATFDGMAWSGPSRLTNDSLADASPALAYDAAGALHLLWLRGGDLVRLEDSWNVANARTVRSASTEGGFLGFTLSRAPNGNLAVVWLGMGEESADLTCAVYDAAADAWSADNTLSAGADVEADPAPAFGSDGTLYAAYRRVATEFVTRTFTISPTRIFTVTNLPQEGQSDLLFLSHTVGRDLTFESLTLTPTNPAAGQAVTLTAVLRNAGDLTVVAPQVAFYDGDTLLGSVQTLPDLDAGYTATLSTTWTVPAPAAAHTLKAVADPNGQVAETDESNNEIARQTTLPDLTVGLLTTDYDTATITITARLVNEGVLTATAPFTVAFRAAEPLTGTLLGTAQVTRTLAAGDGVTVTLALTDPLSLAGLGTRVWAVADSDDAVAEADEGNNTEYAALPLLPDLVLTAEAIEGSEPVSVTVRNAGVVTATAPVLTVRRDGLTGTLLYSGTLPTLGPGDEGTLTFTPSPGTFELWAKVDADNRIAESNEGNNLAVREVTVPFRIYLPLVLRNR